MVHALRQARRVLHPDGYLLDLRPAPIHRRVGLEQDGPYQQLAVMDESFDDDYAANHAVSAMVKAGLCKQTSRVRFECIRRMDRFSDFETWLDEFSRLTKLRSPPDQLLATVSKALESLRGTNSRRAMPRIIVRGPVDLRVLVKL